jgi:hypothetical protein
VTGTEIKKASADALAFLFETVVVQRSNRPARTHHSG